MIENFLRRPQGFAEVAAEILRGLAVLSVVVALVFFELTDAGIIALALPGFVAPRFLGVKAGVDMIFVGALLVAAWSNVFDLYTKIDWWDLPVHLALTGLIAGGIYLLLARAEIVPNPRSPGFTPPAPIVLVTTIGLAIGALWEMIEWLGREFISDQISIGYDDTIGDMAMGGLGSLFAGLVVAFVSLLVPERQSQARKIRSQEKVE